MNITRPNNKLYITQNIVNLFVLPIMYLKYYICNKYLYVKIATVIIPVLIYNTCIIVH